MYLLGRVKEEEQTWNKSTFDLIKCIILRFPDEDQEGIGAKYLSIPLLHQMPKSSTYEE